MQASRRFFVRQFMKGNECQCLGTERRRILKTNLPLEFGLLSVAIVPLFAGNLARPAADTFRNINQRALNGNRGGGLLHALPPEEAAGLASEAEILETFTRQALVSCVPAPGSRASIVRWFTLGPRDSPLKPQL